MAKVSQTCLNKMSQSQKNLMAWRLNWILGREFYRANKNEAAMLKWDAAAFLNVGFPMSYDADPDRIAFFFEVKDGLLANTPGWDDSACTLDMPSLACFCFWLAAIPQPMRLQAVGLLMQTDADIPYLSTVCPNEVTNDPSYSVQEVPPVPGTETCKTSGSACASTSECCENMVCEQGKCAYSKGVEIDKLPPGDKTPGTTIPGATPGTATPVGAKEDPTEKKTNWWLWGGIGAAVILGAAFIGAVRDPEYVVPPPAPNPRGKPPTWKEIDAGIEEVTGDPAFASKIPQGGWRQVQIILTGLLGNELYWITSSFANDVKKEDLDSFYIDDRVGMRRKVSSSYAKDVTRGQVVRAVKELRKIVSASSKTSRKS